jgi:hypothetical protein
MRSIIARIERASPASRRVSPSSNQVKQFWGLLARCCSGRSNTKPYWSASVDQPVP